VPDLVSGALAAYSAEGKMASFIKVVHSFSHWVRWVSALGLVGMMLLTSSDVVLRYCGYPIKGTFDIIGLLGTVVVALPIASTQILGRHVAMEYMTTHESRLIRTTAKGMTSLLSLGIYGIIAWQSTLFGTKLWRIGRVSDTVEIPLFPFAYIIAFGCALNCLVLLSDFYQSFVREEGK